MKALQLIDSRFIALHQMLVDHFNQKPIELARHCVTVCAMCTIFWVAFAFDPSKSFSWLLLVLSAMSPLFLLCCCLSPVMFSMLGGMPFLRLIGFMVLAVKINGLTITPLNSAIDATEALATLSFLYFAACRPPRPKKRHGHSTRLAHSGGGA